MNPILLVASSPDKASMNIHKRLLEFRNWTEDGTFENEPVYKFDNFFMITIGKLHLYYDGIDKAFFNIMGIAPCCVIFLSKHRSESNMRSLTVHPIGCFGKAVFGGRDETLIPSSPQLMTGALRALYKEAKVMRLDYRISFEVTHHGPYIETPAFFIEIGSSEREWVDEEAGKGIAKALVSMQNENHTVAIGFGGGHYAPRMTDLALGRKIAFGHIIPSYAFEQITDEILLQTIKKTAGAKLAYLNRKAMKKSDIDRFTKFLDMNSILIVKEDALDPL